jgi:lipooligosaccharide transport system permease protein
VNRGPGVGVPYLDFVAPGILAATAMQLGTFESSYPVMAAIRWTRQYHAMLATPLRTRDLLIGHQLFVAARLAIVSGIYLVILSGFGVLHSPLAILAWPAAVLVGLAHSAPVSAFSAWLKREEGFNGLFRFVVMPMFLFSGTFFPVTRLPTVLREIAYATPLWNGVDLMRHLTLGTASLWPSVAHVAYLALWVAGGLTLAARKYSRRLIT